jgi:hypothetical protein
VTTPTIIIGGKTYEVPESASAGILEDCAAEVNRLLALGGIPLGEDVKAVRVLLFRVLSEKHAGITEDEVKKGLAARDVFSAYGVVMGALGFRAAPEDSAKGEAGGPSAST